MYCKNCGSEIELNDQFCGKCGSQIDGYDSVCLGCDRQDEPVYDENVDVEDEEKEEEEEEEEGSLIGGIIVLAVIGLAIWALVHFNPSEEDHMEEIKSSIVENIDIYSVDFSNVLTAAMVVDNLEYASIRVASCTYGNYRGRYFIGSIGLCGFVLPLVSIN